MLIESMDSFDLICNSAIRIPANENCEFILPDISEEYHVFPKMAVITQSIPSGQLLEENTELIITATYNNRVQTCKIDIILVDYSWPEFANCLPIQNVPFTQSQGFALPDYTEQVNAIDNCGIISVTQNPAPGTIINDDKTVIITALDTFGNTRDCFVYVYLQDENPEDSLEITCPASQTNTYDNNCSFTIPDYTGMVQVNENNAVITQFPELVQLYLEIQQLF